jgi:hypothetical protein
MLHQREIGLADQVAEGTDVYDVDGQKVGTVARVHCRAQVAPGDAGQVEEPPRPAAIEVRSGFLGFGKHLYIPIDAITDLRDGRLLLTLRRSDLAHEDWQRRPAYLEEPR